METYFGSGDFYHEYTPISRSSSNPRDSRTPVPATPSDMDGIEDIPTYQFKNIEGLTKHITTLSGELLADRSEQQYMVFEGVTKEDLTEIEKARDDNSNMGPSVKMTHFSDRALLIVKLMPSIKHETPHRSLGEDMIRALIRMGTPDRELTAVGAGKYERPTSSKEGDSAWKPKVLRGGPDDWPTIVIECGLSESLARLRGDASWWLSHSNGDVKIVVLISITKAQKRLQIERWCLAPPARYRPNTGLHPNANSPVPTRVQDIDITPNPAAQPNTPPTALYTVVGAPLVLPFRDIFLRAPTGQEHDITFDAAHLSSWANDYWSST